MAQYKAVYRRYYQTIIEEYEALTDAISFLQVGAEFGELYALGVYDNETNSIYLPRSFADRDQVYKALIQALGVADTTPIIDDFALFPQDEE